MQPFFFKIMDSLSQKEKQEFIIAEYATTPTAVLAEKYGMSKNTVMYIAKRHGIKKDFAAQRAYKEAHKPPLPTDQRKETIQQLIADYPYYSNVHLTNKYHMTRGQISNAAKHYHLHKDYDALRKVRKERQKDILADYTTRSTRKMAAEMGVTIDTLRKRANRVGLYKDADFSHHREKGLTLNQKTILAFAKTFPVEDIAKKIGCTTYYVCQVIRKAGLQPITEPKPVRNVIQWTLDGQFVASHPSYRSAAMSLGKKYGAPNIQACAIGKEGHKSAFGYRWTVEIYI